MRTQRTRFLILALAAVMGAAGLAQQVPVPELTLPNEKGSLKFAAIGDSGTGNANQYRLAAVFMHMHPQFPYEFVLMMGDNMYGGESSRDFRRKFELPYKYALDAGVKFYASLGNHDSPNQRMYKLFNMNGERYYTFKPRNGFRFFALDTNYMDRAQLAWLEKELAASGSDWKIVFFHHPIYSSGARHGSNEALRAELEPLFVKHGVDVVFAGHEHFYERLKPQKGIHYFISGGAGKLRRGDVRGRYTEKGFDQGFHFMLAEIIDDKMHFQVISEEGKTVDAGVITRRRNETKAEPSAPAAPPAKPVPATDKPAGSSNRPAATSGQTAKPAPKSTKPAARTVKPAKPAPAKPAAKPAPKRPADNR